MLALVAYIFRLVVGRRHWLGKRGQNYDSSYFERRGQQKGAWYIATGMGVWGVAAGESTPPLGLRHGRIGKTKISWRWGGWGGVWVFGTDENRESYARPKRSKIKASETAKTSKTAVPAKARVLDPKQAKSKRMQHQHKHSKVRDQQAYATTLVEVKAERKGIKHWRNTPWQTRLRLEKGPKKGGQGGRSAGWQQ